MNFEMKSNIVTYNQLVKELDDIYKLYSKKVGCQIPCSGFCILFMNGKNPTLRQKSAMHGITAVRLSIPH